jgi:hypothetical protein
LEKRRYRVFNSDTSTLDISFNILSGSVKILLGKTENFTEKEAVKSYKIEENKDKNKYIKIRPSDFKFTDAHDYYIMLKNFGEHNTILNFVVIENNTRPEL